VVGTRLRSGDGSHYSGGPSLVDGGSEEI